MHLDKNDVELQDMRRERRVYTKLFPYPCATQTHKGMDDVIMNNLQAKRFGAVASFSEVRE